MYERGSVWIESEDGAAIERRDHMRRRFPGFRRRLWWDPFDALPLRRLRPLELLHHPAERLLYTAEVFGKWARANHVCSEHRAFDGLVFPTVRRVTLRGLPGPVLIASDVDGVSVSRP